MIRFDRYRKALSSLILMLAINFAISGCRQGNENSLLVEVYKTPTCSCCLKWIDHLENAGFKVEVKNVRDLAALKTDKGVPGDLQSCHTAMVMGYVIEGHVPAADIKKLLSERPNVVGISVPGMPIGSPGMEMSDSSRDDDYDVISFGDGGNRVFAAHRIGGNSVLH